MLRLPIDLLIFYVVALKFFFNKYLISNFSKNTVLTSFCLIISVIVVEDKLLDKALLLSVDNIWSWSGFMRHELYNRFLTILKELCAMPNLV